MMKTIGKSMNGILVVKKEQGFTSHDVVAKLRGICKQRKIGHTGTLDPNAEGVLPVCFGSATKVCDLLTEQDKTYRAVLRLGITTDTQDVFGTIVSFCESRVSIKELEECIDSFIGGYAQTPPMYSALKVNGQKLYTLARRGIEIERTSRSIVIDSIKITNIRVDNSCVKECEILVSCSKGTYIRTLCHDIGVRLGCGGAMAGLIRERVGQFTIKQALTLSEIQYLMNNNELESCLISVDSLFPYEHLTVKNASISRLLNGNRLSVSDVNTKTLKEGNHYLMYSEDNEFRAIYSAKMSDHEEITLVPEKMFLS